MTKRQVNFFERTHTLRDSTAEIEPDGSLRLHLFVAGNHMISFRVSEHEMRGLCRQLAGVAAARREDAAKLERALRGES